MVPGGNNDQKQWLSTATAGNRRKRITVLAVVVFLVLASAVAGKYFGAAEYLEQAFKKKEQTTSQEQESSLKQVKVKNISAQEEAVSAIETMGEVVSADKARVTARASGEVKDLLFKEGEEVVAGQLLARLENESLRIELANAQTRYNNARKSLQATRETTSQSIEEAKIQVAQAGQGVDTARIGLESAQVALANAQSDYKNAEQLQDRNIQNIQNKAIIAYGGHVNFIKSVLDQVNYIINAEDGPQLQGLDSGILSAKSSATLRGARNLYLDVKDEYEQLSSHTPTRSTIENDMEEVNNILALTSQLASQTVEVLDKTVTSRYFSEEVLNAQKEKYTSLKSNAVDTRSRAEATLNELKDFELSRKKELDALQGGVDSAEKQVKNAEAQLRSARISHESAQEALKSVEKQREQQLVSARSSVDDARGQLHSARNRVEDLEIEAPITGSIITKSVNEGEEVSAGQELYEIANTENIKVIAYISPFDVFDVETGQKVVINGEHQGAINSIIPAADPQTRKVKLEIILDSDAKTLIPQTSVNVSIPTRQEANQTSFVVPLKAVIIEQEGRFVFVADKHNGHYIARKTKVETGKTQDSSIEIIEGLNDGDLVIIEGAKLVEDQEEILISNF